MPHTAAAGAGHYGAGAGDQAAAFGADAAGRRPITVDVLGYTILRVDTGLGFVGAAAAKATDPAFAQVRVGSHLGQRGVADEAGRHP